MHLVVESKDNIPGGDPINGLNSQEFGFQFGINATPSSKEFTVHTRILAPFSGLSPQPSQSMGFYIGTGDQDNYIKLIAWVMLLAPTTRVDRTFD